MGAFLLYPKNTSVTPSEIKYIFKKKGFIKHLEFQLGDYNLLLYSKVLLSKPSFLFLSDNFICSVGTLIYKKRIEKEALSCFLHDFLKNDVSKNDVLGSFCIIIYSQGLLYLTNDDENLYPVYIHDKLSCISSSFLALCQASERLSINRLSLIENLVTGCSIGFDTYFNEIKRFRWGINVILPTFINYFSLKKSINPLSKKDKRGVFNEQKKRLTEVFNQIVPLVNKYGCEIGLSSGFDSRLLYSLCLNFFKNDRVTISTNYKNPPDHDIIIARKIASITNKAIKEVPVTATEKMSNNQFMENILEAFLFYDGQFRVNHGWTREYRTLSYRLKVLDDTLVGLSGHSGELFRNDYNLDSSIFSYNLWIKNSLIGKAGFKKIKSEKDARLLVSNIKKKIQDIEIYTYDDVIMDKKGAHVLYNEIWVTCGPGIRISIENQLSYYLSPFTDFIISKNTYGLAKFLKNASFEKTLIKNFSNDLSKIPYEKKRRNKLPSFIYKLWLYRIGIDIHYFMRSFYRNKMNKNSKMIELLKKYPQLTNIFSNPKLQIIPFKNYVNCSLSVSEIDRLIAFAFVVNFYNNKIDMDNND